MNTPRAAVTPVTGGSSKKATPKTTAASTPAALRTSGPETRDDSQSPLVSKTPDPTSSLSARLGGVVLLDKELEGFIFEDQESEMPKSSRWSAVGKACTNRPVNKTGLESAMTRAGGLHREAWFSDMGSNIFVVHFGS